MDVEKKSWPPLALLKVAAKFLARKNIASPRLDAEVLLAATIGCSRLGLYAQPADAALTPEQLAAYRDRIRRRVAHEPVSRILGKKEFMNCDFLVTPAVLSPRPETEILVEQALRLLAPAPKTKKSARLFRALDLKLREFALQQAAAQGGLLPQEMLDTLNAAAVKEVEVAPVAPVLAAPRILDLGCGGGCVGIMRAKNLPGARIAAVDISTDALAVAKQNAANLGVGERIEFWAGDWFGAVPAGREFDFIVANPPYIPDREPLEPEVKNFDPAPALFGGADGLDAYRAIIGGADKFLPARGGGLAFEVGAGQDAAVSGLIRQKFPRVEIETTPDCAGIARVVSARISLRGEQGGA
jgi:release factor glutamine methyltransferase